MKVLTRCTRTTTHARSAMACCERFTAGLADAGHTSDVVDLYAIKFDPVFRRAGRGQLHQRGDPRGHPRADGSRPEGAELLSRAGPTLPRVTRHARQVARRGRRHDPQPDAEGRARPSSRGSPPHALAFIAPVHFCSFPSILKAWADQLDAGRGFVLVRGLPVDELGEEGAAIAYVVLGLHLGVPVSQNADGDLLGHVRDDGSILTTRRCGATAPAGAAVPRRRVRRGRPAVPAAGEVGWPVADRQLGHRSTTSWRDDVPISNRLLARAVVLRPLR